MRLTYTQMYNQFLRNISAVGSTDVDIKSEFDTELGQTYQLMLSKLANYKTSTSVPFSTAANVQEYYYPQGEVTLEGVVITVGSVNFPLRIISSEYDWEQLHAILIQASALPQFFFPRRDTFSVWPIPQDNYSGTIYYHYRDRNLSVQDYVSGSITVTANSATVNGSGTTFTPAMVGRWFTITDPTVFGQGYWYRIATYVSATQILLNTPYRGSAATGASYLIGESPELPEEGHMTLVDGVTANFYAHMRKDTTEATRFFNMFYTGDPGNNSRKEGDTQISGGLIGLINRYSDRDDTRIINRRPRMNPLQWKMWGATLA